MRHFRTLYVIALALWCADFLTKVWAISYLSDRPRVKIIGEFLQLTYLENTGAAFSFATGSTIFLSLFALLVAAIIIRYSRVIASRSWAVVLGLVLGGIFGNITDRVVRAPGLLRGPVIDWIEIPHWPVFNLADSGIFIASITATILTLRNISPLATSKEKEGER